MRALLLVLPMLVLVAGCVTPGRSYAGHHPELPAAYRQILVSGIIPNGDAVAGMTREQVTLAMGAAASFDKINGEDVWNYMGKKLSVNSSMAAPTGDTAGSSFAKPEPLPELDSGSAPEGEIYTSVFFRGALATHAIVSEHKP